MYIFFVHIAADVTAVNAAVWLLVYRFFVILQMVNNIIQHEEIYIGFGDC